MKRSFAAALPCVALLAASCQAGVNPGDLRTQQDSVSYALGTLIASSIQQQFKQMPFDTIDFKLYAEALKNSKPSERYLEYISSRLDTINPDLFMGAVRTVLANGKGLIESDQAETICNNKDQQMRTAAEEKRKAEGIRNNAEGQAFLEKNATAEGVVKLESGLQYKVITAGTGAKPGATDRVKVKYRGSLLDGTVFDETKEEPITLSVGGVIKGWQEALQLMPVGSKWQLFIPGDLAYGERGGGEKIGPNATLLFDIELIEIVK